jgi:hypothetical protein
LAAISVLSGLLTTFAGFMLFGRLGLLSALLVLVGTAGLVGGMLLVAAADRPR